MCTQDGNELYVFPVEKYLRAGEELSFFDVIRRARQKAEIVIGYQVPIVIATARRSKQSLTASAKKVQAM